MWDVDLVQYVSPDEEDPGPGCGNGRQKSAKNLDKRPYMAHHDYFHENQKELVILVANLSDKESIVRFSVLFITCNSDEDNREMYLFDPRTNDSGYGRWQSSYGTLALELSFLMKIMDYRTLKILNLRVKDDDMHGDSVLCFMGNSPYFL